MNVAVFIAFITSGTSVIVAVLSYLNSKASNKTAYKASKELETLKFNFEKAKILFKISETHLNSKLLALDKHIILIQKFKDTMLLAIASSNDELHAQSLLNSVNAERIAFFSCYETEAVNLDNEEYKVAHKAKNLTFYIQQFMAEILKQKKYVNFENEEKRKLAELREQLNDCQNLLRDKKFSLLYS